MSYSALEARFAAIANIDHAIAVLSWDESVMMPPRGGPGRADALAALAEVRHRMASAPELVDLLAGVRGETLDPWQAANLREMGREIAAAVCVPTDLVARLSHATATCEQIWRAARAENRWQDVERPLAEVLVLARERAACLAQAQRCAPYDALLDEHQSGLTMRMLDPIFATLSDALPALIDRVIDRQRNAGDALSTQMPIAAQAGLGQALMNRLGFDFERGRLDTTHHPFCGGQPDDVRVTTRYDEANFLSGCLATLHETGHALYEQGLPRPWRSQPVGRSAGMAVHESQSLLVEMQICRDRPFLAGVRPIVERHLGRDVSLDALVAAVARVERSYVRVDADEATYPLHVIFRYALERQLIAGSLAVRDIPAAWDAEMRSKLGLSTHGDDRRGCLQDVHWFHGLFGYFPCYTVGALIAAQLYARMRADLPALDAAIERGDLSIPVAWLRREVHGRGRLLPGLEIVAAATGQPVSTAPFLAHLARRYTD